MPHKIYREFLIASAYVEEMRALILKQRALVEQMAREGRDVQEAERLLSDMVARWKALRLRSDRMREQGESFRTRDIGSPGARPSDD